MRMPLNRDNPVPTQFQGEFFVQSIDERWSVLVQQRHETDRAFLRLTTGERERARVDELAPQRLVPALCRLNHLAVQRLQVMLHPRKRRPGRALEGGIERG